MRAAVLIGILLAAAGVAAASDYRFVYGDTTDWYTYNPYRPYDRSYGSAPSNYYVRDHSGVVYRSSSFDRSVYVQISRPDPVYTCVGTGCGRVPYVYPQGRSCRVSGRTYW